MRSKRTKAALILILAFLLFSCDNLAGFIGNLSSPPFVITRPVFETSERPNNFYYSGISFNFLNMAAETVDSITVSFMLFVPETEVNPVMGNMQYEITKLDLVHPNENREILISLDKYIYFAPSGPYIIDSFYVSEIHYANGSIWQDKYGKYKVG